MSNVRNGVCLFACLYNLLFKKLGGNLHDNFAIHAAIHAYYCHAVMRSCHADYQSPSISYYVITYNRPSKQRHSVTRRLYSYIDRRKFDGVEKRERCAGLLGQ